MGSRARSTTLHARLVVSGLAVLAIAVPASIAPGPARAADPVLAPGFQETTVFSGLQFPTAIRFAADGRVFVAEKSGRIKIFDSLADPTPTSYSGLMTNVHNYWDRGLLGLALDPSMTGGSGSGSYVYVGYAYDHILGDEDPAPRWGDGCPGPTSVPPGPGGNTDGCVISGRISRLAVSGSTVTGPEDVLVEDWCQQYPSHSFGSLQFGPDGSLYASGGDGANFVGVDYGQRGGTTDPVVTPKNPCGDPPNDAMTPPTAEGGALRSQDVRTTSDPTGLGGTLIRINRDTGAGVAGNPFAGSSDANAKRIIAYGVRNAFRFTFRPGTNQLWLGDVGWETWEEIDRIPNATDGVAENFGWPCYEGTGHQPTYDATNLDLCESLYTAGGVTAPMFVYEHEAPVVTGEDCPSGSSSITGMAFYPASGGSFPAAYQGGLFFADHSRNCIWFIPKGGDGEPDPAAVAKFVEDAANPVDLVVGPGGDLYYVDFEGGTIRKISPIPPNEPPTAVIAADPTSGPLPLTVDFDGSGSSDPEGLPLTYAWDLDGDGQFDDATGATAQRTYSSQGNVTVGLKVTDAGAETDTATTVIGAGNGPPVPVISTPTAGTKWKVGDTISFSGSATDPEDGSVPASGLSWKLILQHCPATCHTHVLQTWSDAASGSFVAPDHSYPSYLELTLKATDSFGTEASVTRRLDPKTVVLSFRTSVAGLKLAVGSSTSTAPFSRTVIVGSSNSVTATSPQTITSGTYAYSSWSDGQAQSHQIVAPATNTTYTATYHATKLTIQPLADAQVKSAHPGTNYGAASTLRVRKAKARTYLKFVVDGLSGPPSSAMIRLWVTNAGPDAGRLYRVPTSWTEGGITWNNAPSPTGGVLDYAGPAKSGTWLIVNVTAAVTGDGRYAFVLRGGTADFVDFASGETTHDPLLVIVP